MPDRAPAIIYSDLCRVVSAEGITVKVHIYRPAHDPQWALEVVNETGTATIWDKLFDTDQKALEFFERTVAEEGMASFLDGDDTETIH